MAKTATRRQNSPRTRRANRAKDRTEQDVAGMLAAINRSQAVVEFEMDGTIITANDNFLRPLGYSLEEVQGQHHSMFVEPVEKVSAEYKAFWDRLNRDEYSTGQYKNSALPTSPVRSARCISHRR